MLKKILICFGIILFFVLMYNLIDLSPSSKDDFKILGIDISHHNKIYDWNQINKQADFCIIKASEGKSYKESSKNIDYTHLGEWCKNREGQVIVCETNKAKWLDFEPLKVILNSGRGRTEEVVWLNDNNIRQRTLF